MDPIDVGGCGERLDRLDESVMLIRRLLDGERVTYDGRFYRFVPNVNGRLAAGGQLFMLKVKKVRKADLGKSYANGTTFDVEWVPIATPDDPDGTTSDDFVWSQGRAQGAATLLGFPIPNDTIFSNNSPRDRRELAAFGLEVALLCLKIGELLLAAGEDERAHIRKLTCRARPRRLFSSPFSGAVRAVGRD